MKSTNFFENRARNRVYLILLIVISTLIRVWYIFKYSSPSEYILYDGRYFDINASAMLHSNVNWFFPAITPFYYVMLSVFYFIFELFGVYQHKYLLMPIVNTIISCLGTYFVFKITEKLHSAKAAYLASALYAFYYPYVYYNIFIQAENLFVFFILFIIYFIMYRLSDSLSYAILGLILGLTNAMRPIFLFFIPLFFIWYLHNNKSNLRKSISNLLIVTFVIAIIMFFQTYFIFSVTDGSVKSPFTAGGLNFALTWCDVKEIKYELNGDWYQVWAVANKGYPEDRKIFTHVPFTDSGYYYQLGLNCLKEEPIRLLTNFKQIPRLFYSNIAPWGFSVFAYRQLLLFSYIYTYLIFLPLSVYSFFRIKKENRKFAILLMLFIASLFIIVYTQVPGEERYLIPYNFVFFILGSIGFIEIGAFKGLLKSKSKK